MSGSKLLDASSHENKPETSQGDHPIGLTVYSMPEPEQVMAQEARRTGRGRWKMILILLVCAAPVVASYLTYYVIRPQARHSFGVLIDPQRALPDLSTVSLEGRISNLRELKGQWLLVSVGSGDCDAACVQQLYFQRQLRESLGKDKDRVDRVWLITDGHAVSEAMKAGLQQATVLRVAQAPLAQWLEPAQGHALTEHLYVVDPMGNWMMRFPANLDLGVAGKAKRDLERLLRASASWDQPGR